MDDETNRLRGEFLGAFQKAHQPEPEPPDSQSIGLMVEEIREEAKRVYEATLARCDAIEKLLHAGKDDANTVAEKIIGMMKRMT